MAQQMCILMPKAGLVLRQMDRRNAQEIFTLIDRNREHLATWWDNDFPLYRDEGEVAEMMFSPGSGSIRFGLWKGDALIGYLGVTQSSLAYGVACFGYWISKEECGKGYAAHMVGQFTQYAFEHMGLDTLYAFVKPNNIASRQVLVRNGYVAAHISCDELRFERTKTDCQAA